MNKETNLQIIEDLLTEAARYHLTQYHTKKPKRKTNLTPPKKKRKK